MFDVRCCCRFDVLGASFWLYEASSFASRFPLGPKMSDWLFTTPKDASWRDSWRMRTASTCSFPASLSTSCLLNYTGFNTLFNLNAALAIEAGECVLGVPTVGLGTSSARFASIL